MESTTPQHTAPEVVQRRIVKAAFRLLSSFFRGLGISVGLVLVVWVFFVLDGRQEERKRQAEASVPMRSGWYKKFGPDAKLKLEPQEPVRSHDNLVIFGRVLNEGTGSWSNSQVEAQLFASDGKLVGLCRGWAIGILRPGETRFFSVDCDGTQAKPVAKYSTYNLQIVQAQYELDEGT